MHAASVHPEPGSNSLKNGYIQLFRAAHTYFLELAYLSFLLLFRVFQSDFDEIPSHTRISISICVQNPVVQFSMTKRRVFSGLPIIADRFSFVKPFLEIFSNFFFARRKNRLFS